MSDNDDWDYAEAMEMADMAADERDDLAAKLAAMTAERVVGQFDSSSSQS